MEIDFIKWMVGYADGFEYQKRDDLRFDTIKTPDSEFWNVKTVKDYHTRWGILLQSAIEGINRNAYKPGTHGNPRIFQEYDSIRLAIHENGKQVESYPVFFFKKYGSENQAKEKALMHIREQEPKDAND